MKTETTPTPALPTLWTSAEAKRRNQDNAATQRAAVYAYISAQGARGATDDEVQRALGLAGNTQRPRRLELAERGSVVASGETRPTAAGRKAAVWVAVEGVGAQTGGAA